MIIIEKIKDIIKLKKKNSYMSIKLLLVLSLVFFSITVGLIIQ